MQDPAHLEKLRNWARWQMKGEDNGWILSLVYPLIIDFDKLIAKYPSIRRFVGGASTDLVANLQQPDNPIPLLKDQVSH